jgi:uncharacterized protein (TIGR03437 family)
MGAPRKLALDRRLDAYFATLRASPFRERFKRSMGNWQLYAAVTGSAMAMVTSASASIIGTGSRLATDPVGSARTNKDALADPRFITFQNAVPFAVAENRGRAVSAAAGAPVASASQMEAPSIAAGGVVPLDSVVNTIQPGEWVSIFGSNLASETAYWNGDFPTSLGGTSVEINGKPAYLSFVSPGQINLQAPGDTAMGTVCVVVTTAAGKGSSVVTLAQVSPSFSLIEKLHVSGIILRPDNSGAYGGGSYDILGPNGTPFGYPTVAAREGDSVEIFGFGFGPTDPSVQPGKAFSGAVRITGSFRLYINDVLIQPTFVGLTSAGLYQVNFVVPANLGRGELPIEAVVDGVPTQKHVYFSLQSGLYPGGTTFATVGPIGVGTLGFGFTGTGGGGTGGGGTGGGGGGGTGGGGGGTGGGSGGGSGGSIALPNGRQPYLPKLRFGS